MNERQEQMLWDEVDEAERHLLSGAFHEAQATAATVLFRTSALSTTKKTISAVLDDIAVSSAMVLLQAQHERGRHDELEGQFLKAFANLDAVPPEVFLTWSCLRIKAGDKDGAEAAVAMYLESRGSELDRRAGCSLAGLYVLDLLCEHRKKPQQAEDWLLQQSGWLDAATTRVLLKKVRRRQQRAGSSPKRPIEAPDQQANGHPQSPLPLTNEPPRVTPLPLASQPLTPSEPSNATTEPLTERLETAHNLSTSSPEVNLTRNGGPDLRVSSAGVRSGWLSWLLYWAALAQGWWRRGWQTGHRKWRQATGVSGKRALLMALAAGVFFYAMLKERATLRRHLRKVLHSCQQNLSDLYGLAFSYSLNPLASAAQLSAQAVPRP